MEIKVSRSFWEANFYKKETYSLGVMKLLNFRTLMEQPKKKLFLNLEKFQSFKIKCSTHFDHYSIIKIKKSESKFGTSVLFLFNFKILQLNLQKYS